MALAGPAFCTGLQCRRNRGAEGAIASQILEGLEANPSPLQFILRRPHNVKTKMEISSSKGEGFAFNPAKI